MTQYEVTVLRMFKGYLNTKFEVLTDPVSPLPQLLRSLLLV